MHRTKRVSGKRQKGHGNRRTESIAGQGSRIAGLDNLEAYKARQSKLETVWHSGRGVGSQSAGSRDLLKDEASVDQVPFQAPLVTRDIDPLPPTTRDIEDERSLDKGRRQT